MVFDQLLSSLFLLLLLQIIGRQLTSSCVPYTSIITILIYFKSFETNRKNVYKK